MKSHLFFNQFLSSFWQLSKTLWPSEAFYFHTFMISCLGYFRNGFFCCIFKWLPCHRMHQWCVVWMLLLLVPLHRCQCSAVRCMLMASSFRCFLQRQELWDAPMISWNSEETFSSQSLEEQLQPNSSECLWKPLPENIELFSVNVAKKGASVIAKYSSTGPNSFLFGQDYKRIVELSWHSFKVKMNISNLELFLFGMGQYESPFILLLDFMLKIIIKRCFTRWW